MTTSYVKNIFITGANRFEANIKKHGADILSECSEFMVLIADKKSDAMRKAILADKRWAFLYDTAPTKQGGKETMSPRMRQVKSAMTDIFDHAEQFIAWYASDEKTGVTSLRGIRDAIKPKPEKSDEPSQKNGADGADGADGGDSETETQETETVIENQPITKDELYAQFLKAWKDAGFGDSIAFDQYVATENAGKVADKIDMVA